MIYANDVGYLVPAVSQALRRGIAGDDLIARACEREPVGLTVCVQWYAMAACFLASFLGVSQISLK